LQIILGDAAFVRQQIELAHSAEKPVGSRRSEAPKRLNLSLFGASSVES
jgi:hypothetical protein